MQVQLSREHRYADVARAVAAQLQLQAPERLRFTHHNSYQDVRPCADSPLPSCWALKCLIDQQPPDLLRVGNGQLYLGSCPQCHPTAGGVGHAHRLPGTGLAHGAWATGHAGCCQRLSTCRPERQNAGAMLDYAQASNWVPSSYPKHWSMCRCPCTRQ